MVDITSLVDLSGIVDSEAIDAADVTVPFNNVIDILNDMLNGVQVFDEVEATVAQITTLTTTGAVVMERDGADATPFFSSYGDATAIYLTGRRARNTKASPQAVQAGDVLAGLSGRGNTGSGFGSDQARIEIQANQTFTASNKGTKIVLRTTPDGSTTMADALIIHNDKSLEIEGDFNHDGTNFAFCGTAPAPRSTGWTTFSNLVTDKTCDANSTSVAELADILGTLIEQLKLHGILAA